MRAWIIHACLAAILSVSLAANATSDLKVYAASSMTNAIDEIAHNFEQHYDITVTPVYGGSSSIARQILNGAPADIFISANAKWMNYLVDYKAINSDNVTNLVQNQLAVIAPQAAPIESFNVSDANAWSKVLDGNRLALGNPTSVPAGMYAQESLIHLGVWSQLAHQIAPTKNVRLALALVERGEAPLGVVYKTDAKLSNKVKVVAELAHDTHSDIVYPAAVVNDSVQSERFFQYLQSDEAKHVFARYGFQ